MSRSFLFLYIITLLMNKVLMTVQLHFFTYFVNHFKTLSPFWRTSFSGYLTLTSIFIVNWFVSFVDPTTQRDPSPLHFYDLVLLHLHNISIFLYVILSFFCLSLPSTYYHFSLHLKLVSTPHVQNTTHVTLVLLICTNVFYFNTSNSILLLLLTRDSLKRIE